VLANPSQSLQSSLIPQRPWARGKEIATSPDNGFFGIGKGDLCVLNTLVANLKNTQYMNK
jgi:hypothetical protein